MKKLLHERLREWAENKTPLSIMEDEEGAYFMGGVLGKWADEIERYYIPRDKFISEIDSLICDLDNSYRKADKSIPGNRKGLKIIHDRLKTIRNDVRSSPKVLDADGVEIKVGQNRYSIRTGEYLAVNKVGAERCLCTVLGDGCTLGTCGYEPSELSNKEPDSLEKLRDDMRSFGEVGADCTSDCCLQYADRLTALIERED